MRRAYQHTETLFVEIKIKVQNQSSRHRWHMQVASPSQKF